LSREQSHARMSYAEAMVIFEQSLNERFSFF